ncbi:MAG: hypothetical protein HYV93_26140 [Candidatus Rokubacteria bacterium]|nr:hypothetical protein [Candidatus Rokubacteria bacterium]
MHSLALVILVCLTSVGAYLVGTRVAGLRRVHLKEATAEALECLGLAVAFLVGNLAVGIVLIFGLRTLTGRFISVYVVDDATLAVLSLLQALVVQRWRGRSR